MKESIIEKSEKRKKYKKEYQNQLCSYNGQILTLNALVIRFHKAGIPHPTAEAKKYLLNNNPIEFYDVYPWWDMWSSTPLYLTKFIICNIIKTLLIL